MSSLIALVGETASGKSALAVELAERFNGEIICADSRTIYRGMDIGTAKPTAEEQSTVPHHLLDIVPPDQSFSAAAFKEQALAAITDITERGKLPIMVGGTGLYVDSVLYDYQFRTSADPSERKRLNALSVKTLQQMLQEKGIPLPNNERNPRHLIRVIETGGQVAERGPLRPGTLIMGVRMEREEVVRRVTARVKAMFQTGLEQEVRGLAERYGWEAPGLQTIGYREWQPYFGERQTLQATQDLILKNTLQYAKRQRTWFRRNNSIQWGSNRGEITNFVVQFTSSLNK